MKEVLSKKNVEYKYYEIGESIANLKAFLKIRDFSDEFHEVKKNNKVGIPCIVKDGEILLGEKVDEFINSL